MRRSSSASRRERHRSTAVAGLDRFAGLGVFYTPPTVHDEIRPGAPVVIVGGGNSAGQVATSLAARGNPVTIVIRGTDLAASMSAYLIERITDQPGITVRPHSAVREVDGSQRLERVIVEDLLTSARDTQPAAALFILIGAQPHTGWLAETLLLDNHGY